MFFSYKEDPVSLPNKYTAEAKFWENTLSQYVDWYSGKLKVLYGEKSPTEKQKVKVKKMQDSAILTWEKIHQQAKYLEDLALSRNAFKDLTLIDIGSGPHPSARVFNVNQLYCLDPLLGEYIKAGFPMHYYDKVKFIASSAEDIPLRNKSVDAVISVNALDHVDDFEATAHEINRILKRGGKLRFHLHYHKATTEEPLELTDQRVSDAFSWAPNFHKIKESRHKRGTKLSNKDEKYVLWSNF